MFGPLLLLLGCTAPSNPAAPIEDPLCACSNVEVPTAPVTDEASLTALLAVVQAALYPDLDGAHIGIAAVVDLQFFRAWTEVETVGDEPFDREYTIEYDPVVLADPPEPAAIVAVLAHELGHVLDYLAMDGQELLDFALWYASQDPATSEELATYERATDEKALDRGCAEGLSTLRTWIYAHVDGDVEAEKKKDYYTPEEIEAWVAEHGACGD